MNETVAAFVGVETVLPGRVKGSSVGVLEVDVKGRSICATGSFSPGEQVTCFIRPESVVIFPADYTDGSSARNLFPDTVVKIQTIGLLSGYRSTAGFTSSPT